MAKYTKLLEIVEAVQVSKVADSDVLAAYDAKASQVGKACPQCGQAWELHLTRPLGAVWYDLICPGTWLITREDGRIEYLDDATFQKRYTIVPEVIKH